MKTLHLFPAIDQHLIEVLSSLTDDDWSKPTVAKKWSVKDIAAHLLDVTIRDISIYRDSYFSEPPAAVNSYKELVDYLNRLNAEWVNAFKRVSPRQIVDMLAEASKIQYEELCKLDMMQPALFSVAWAGESISTNEFHIAREYTEKLHHQLQIRDAVGKCNEIMEPELFTPFIHTLLRGLPNVYRDIDAPEGTCIQIVIPPFGKWSLLKEVAGWSLELGGSEPCVATIQIDPETAWKLFTKAITKEEAGNKIRIDGNLHLSEIALSMISVMA